MNLAYHLAQFGWQSWPLSAVGKDQLGDELLERLKHWGVNTGYINTLENYSTGLVKVALKDGIPSYNIIEDVAWDHIHVPEDLHQSGSAVSAVIFGSLSQRSSDNQKSLSRILELCPNALKIFDVNLRPPYVDTDIILKLAAKSDLLKVNDEEIAELLNRPTSTKELESAARSLAQETGCKMICVTAGAEGAGLLKDGEWHWVSAEPIEVKDTIGAGDSFLSAVVDGLLEGKKTPNEILRSATRLAGFVASRSGATPAYTLDILN